MSSKSKWQYSIIVPIYQNFSILQIFLESLQSTILPETEIILISDGCPQEVKTLIEKYQRVFFSNHNVKIIYHESPKGSVKSINEGLLIANGNFVFFLDSDIILQNSWQKEFLETFKQNSTIGIVGGVLLYPQTGGIQHCGVVFTSDMGRHLYLNGQVKGLPKNIYEVQSIVFAFCCIKKDVFTKGGYLDEEYFNGYEDYDFNFSARRNGFQVVVNPGIIAYHWEKSNGKHRTFNRKKNLARFWRKWGNTVQCDFWPFLFKSLQNKVDKNNIEFVGIDLCEARAEAITFWEEIKRTESVNITHVVDCSHRVKSDENIWLSEVMDKDLHRYSARFLFIVDNFVKLQNNYYWYEIRKCVRGDDLIADMYANVYEFSEINSACWPGNKIR